MDPTDARALAAAARERTDQLLASVREVDDVEVAAPSALPEWSRLTIVCHLRYGHRAVLRLTLDTLAGRPSAYYPGGRDHQRPGTLVPGDGESASDVIDDWATAAEELNDLWADLSDDEWRLTIEEPLDNHDLGPVTLGRLALSRLTEVDVHAVDLDLALPDWSTTLVRVGLPTRLAALATRRSNHRPVDRSVQGSWLLLGDDDFRWRLAVEGDRVESRPAVDDDTADATITGTNRDLFALLLGRPPHSRLHLTGDVALAQAFPLAFPGP